MNDVLNSSNLWWAVAVAIALPIAMVALTEVHGYLERRESRMARPVLMLRNFILPALALLLLMTRASGLSRQATPVRIVATVLAVLVLLFVLSGVNVLLFGRAEAGSWRRRLPSIFIDIGRLAIVATALAILLSQVWGADVGALFTALGVTSIVIGLALQNAVGSIVSGLLLLFEQPFTLGDHLETSAGTGRVVEVNWRSVHLDTGNAVQIIPNASLAGGSFANLSRPTVEHDEVVEFAFSTTDSPSQVCAVLEASAAQLPFEMGAPASAAPLGGGGYSIVLHLANLVDRSGARAQLITWVWYAARRVGLHLDGADPQEFATPERVTEAVRSIAPSLQLSAEDAEELAPRARLVSFGKGELVTRIGVIPSSLGVLVSGAMATGSGQGSDFRPLLQIDVGGFASPTALTQEAARLSVVALSECLLVLIPVEVVRGLVEENPRLARDLSTEIDSRRALLSGSEANAGRG